MKKPATNRVNMIGKTYNSWRVIEHVETANKIAKYKCECLECNTTHTVDGRNIRSGLSKRCSECGLKSGHKRQAGQIRVKRTALESAYYYFYGHLVKDARKRKLDWALSQEEAINLVLKNCHYCGIEPLNACSPLTHQGLSQKRTAEATFLRNGIDRIDSSIGYVKGNVVSCCPNCNKAKLAMSTEAFLAWAKRLATHQGWSK